MIDRGSQSLDVINQAIEANRLTHALLLKGRNLHALTDAANQIAGKLLSRDPQQVAHHPDYSVLQPTNRMRQINVENTRELIRKIQHTPNQGDRKVGIVLEVDRMNRESANAFLKTLEEPPLNTNLILITTRPYALLDTIVSRCLSFWFTQPESPIEDAGWQLWKQKYHAWLSSLQQPIQEKSAIADRMFTLYHLLEEFTKTEENRVASLWAQEKEQLDENLSDEELIAREVGLAKWTRNQLLAEVEYSLRDFAVTAINQSPGQTEEIAVRLEDSVKELEKLRSLLELNLNQSKMLEAFFLKSLRIWSQR